MLNLRLPRSRPPTTSRKRGFRWYRGPRMHRFVFSVAAATSLAACKFPPPTNVDEDAGDVDGAVLDAPASDAANGPVDAVPVDAVDASVPQHTLQVTRSGTGAAFGTVSSNPPGIDCGPDCSEVYDHDTDVVLTASVQPNATFTGWTGSGCSGTGPCMIDMLGARTVDATFTLERYTVTVEKSGFGTGTVTGTGFNCGTDCTETLDHDETVTLTATPTPGDIFFGWSGGGCSGTGTCTVTVTAATTVTATFDNCARSTQTCTAGNFTQCNAQGDFVSYLIPNGGAGGTPTTIQMNAYACPMGCHATQPRCLDISASNGLNAALDSVATSPTGLDLVLNEPGDTLINTSTFDAATGTTLVTPPIGAPITVPATVITQTGAPAILVLNVRTFAIAQGTTVKVQGSRALAIASHFDIYIAGRLDLSGSTINGGGGESLVSLCQAAGSGAATGGGGNWNSGGNASTSAMGGAALSSNTLVPLQGGCRSGAITPTGPGRPLGSTAGGAVQMISRTKLVLDSTGVVDVSGMRGFGSTNMTTGAVYAQGGSAGGGVLIEAPAVALAAGSVIAGRGGSGGAANTATATIAVGLDGTLTGTSVPGASCSGCGTGGDGGTESSPPTHGSGSSPAIAGGGGSVGRCFIRNRSGVLSPPSGTMKIFHQTLTLSSR